MSASFSGWRVWICIAESEREGNLDNGIVRFTTECTHLQATYAASNGADSIGPLFTSPGTPVKGATGGISETIGVAVVIIEEPRAMEFIVGKDELAISDSIDAIEEALTVESPR